MTDRWLTRWRRGDRLSVEMKLAVDGIGYNDAGDRLVLCHHVDTGRHYAYNARLDTLEAT